MSDQQQDDSKLPPHSIPAEESVIGAILLSPSDNIGICVEMFKDHDVFYELRHKIIYNTMAEMSAKGQTVDLMTLQQKLKDRMQLDGIGGLAYLSSLPDKGITAFHVQEYATIVWEKFVLRNIVHEGSRIVSEAMGNIPDKEFKDIVSDAEAGILSATRSSSSKADISIQTFVKLAVDKLEEGFNNKGKLLGISTGFLALDELLQGLQPEDVTVIAARPSVGKTSLAMNIAEHVAINEKIPVGIISMEMGGVSLTIRMIASQARVNVRRMLAGHLTEFDFPKIVGGAGRLNSAPFHICEEPGLSINNIQSKMRRFVQQYGVKLFVVDYLQLAHSTSRKAQNNRAQEVSEISGGIKFVTRELKVHTILISQLNREISKEKTIRKPRISDLRESGSIEQDADNILLLYKPAGENEEEEDGLPNKATTEPYTVGIVVPKQRNGPQGEIYLTFNPGLTKFEPIVAPPKISQEDANWQREKAEETTD